ncbi:MAG: queuosine salvage family protein [Candidatus Saccharibacteria bacterium]
MTIKEKILEPARGFLGNSRFVKIDQEQLNRLAAALADSPLPEAGNLFFPDFKSNAYFSFFINSINFCFWSRKDSPKWGIEQDGHAITGYYGFVEAAKRAFAADKRLWEPDYLSEISFEEFRRIFTGTGGELLLFPERHEIICENFEILCGYYVGEIERLVNSGGADINAFLDNLTRDFPSFRDQAEIPGRTLYFLKRAQLFACELARAGAPFRNVADLAVFTDYKLPQLLQAEGVLAYEESLLAKIKAEEPLPANSDEELEIRAATVVSCELIRDELARLNRDLTSADLDFLLWVAAKQRQFALPHHKTMTINY